jgi:alpha-beta hydrolase superfamily lysophospholipase
MRHTEGNFSSIDRTRLYFQSWYPEQAYKATLAIVHGAGEHCGRYANVVNYFVDRDYALYGFDLRGHGRSGGRKSHVSGWQQYRDDLRCFLQLVRQQNPDKPISALIASSPALAQPDVSPWLLRLGKLLAVFWPLVTLQNGIDVQGISRDPQVVRAYREDSLVSSKISARFGVEFMDCIERVQLNASKIGIPLFMFHGEADRIIPVAGTRQFFDRISSTEKKLKIYPDGFHEPHNDLQKREVFEDVEKWLGTRLGFE